MKADHFKNFIENINEKFDTLIEGQPLLNEKLDRHSDENREEFKEVKKDILLLKKDVFEIKKDVSGLRKDLNEHRENTELHVVKKKKRLRKDHTTLF
jgi:hypothetical protein